MVTAVRDGTVAEANDLNLPADLSVAGKVVLPGLVNGHDHLRSLLPFTRRSDTSALADLIEAGRLAGTAATAEDYRALTALASARQVLSGVVSAVDHVYPLHDEAMLRAVVEGHAEAGLRGQIAYGVSTAIDLDRAVAAADDVVPAERLYLAPVSLRQTSVDDYRASVAAAERTGLRLYTHIAETRDEVERCQAETGLRPIEFLHSIGFLRPGTVLVHCVQVNDAEIELLAQNSVSVVYCPSNHLKLAKGFAPVLAMRDAGVRVCLGIDGMTDLFTEMRQAVYAQGSAAARPGALTTESAWRMGTTDGSAAIGDGDPGLITVAADDVRLAPLVDPVHALVHRGSGPQVRDVLVDGELVVRDGELVKADLAELTERAWKATRGIAERTGKEVRSDWNWQQN
ncbi:amidohydrolase [Kribbella hippodromi]|uniref:Amidohydrolase n=1 Tax=Kribbella hippodromi TaxID=434347 RepID=A0ABN2D9G0_9ACTN